MKNQNIEPAKAQMWIRKPVTEVFEAFLIHLLTKLLAQKQFGKLVLFDDESKF